MPGGDPRNYPSSGSSVLLPLKPSPAEAEVLICGGAPAGSYLQASQNKTFLPALDTCGRITITDEAPAWSMETMPVARVMGDMVLLPGGDVLLINGAAAGTAGWEFGREPVLTPVLYRPEATAGTRFEVQAASATPRLYHSTAVLLRDGRVLVGGSNPHVKYEFWGVEYPTELSLEAFSPAYLGAEKAALRPQISAPAMSVHLSYGEAFTMEYSVGRASEGGVKVTMVAPSFATHSFSMNQRLLFLETELASAGDGGARKVVAVAPASTNLAPAGYYMVHIVNGGIPSKGMWVHLQ
ncbi:aldehyde oxidase GLOX-like [Canna indica]|uniref:Aldehyde oxidase GLOX-like n=1 Tax=Canna indica TaxID=4628 RepID=A0AAQ3KNN2_9LILI|nr:aldehyde oxidase GLOX-like [Canna indica]